MSEQDKTRLDKMQAKAQLKPRKVRTKQSRERYDKLSSVETCDKYNSIKT